MSFLSLLLKCFSDVFAEVLKDVLKTPAVTNEINTIAGELPLPTDNINDIVDRYDGVFNRS